MCHWTYGQNGTVLQLQYPPSFLWSSLSHGVYFVWWTHTFLLIWIPNPHICFVVPGLTPQLNIYKLENPVGHSNCLPLLLSFTMPLQKSLPHHIPFYFAAHTQPHYTPTTTCSTSQGLKAQQTEDLNTHNLLPTQLCKLKQDLELYNNLGQMVTFCTILNNWVVWDQYEHFFLSWPFCNI